MLYYVLGRWVSSLVPKTSDGGLGMSLGFD